MPFCVMAPSLVRAKPAWRWAFERARWNAPLEASIQSRTDIKPDSKPPFCNQPPRIHFVSSTPETLYTPASCEA
jgi:hypothetical protein